MEIQHVEALEGKIKKLQTALTSFSVSEDFDELWKIIHRPGWTTPAEGIFASGLIESMIGQVEVLASMRKMLLTASREVGKT